MGPKKPTKAALAKAKAAEAKAAKAQEATAIEEEVVPEIETPNVTFSIEDQPVVEVGTIDKNEVLNAPPGLNVQTNIPAGADTSSVVSSLLNLKSADPSVPLKTADDIVSIVPGVSTDVSTAPVESTDVETVVMTESIAEEEKVVEEVVIPVVTNKKVKNNAGVAVPVSTPVPEPIVPEEGSVGAENTPVPVPETVPQEGSVGAENKPYSAEAQAEKPVIQHEPVTAERIEAAGLEIIEGEAEEVTAKRLRKKENQIKAAAGKALKAASAETSTPESEELTALVKAAMSKKASMLNTEKQRAARLGSLNKYAAPDAAPVDFSDIYSEASIAARKEKQEGFKKGNQQPAQAGPTMASYGPAGGDGSNNGSFSGHRDDSAVRVGGYDMPKSQKYAPISAKDRFPSSQGNIAMSQMYPTNQAPQGGAQYSQPQGQYGAQYSQPLGGGSYSNHRDYQAPATSSTAPAAYSYPAPAYQAPVLPTQSSSNMNQKWEPPYRKTPYGQKPVVKQLQYPSSYSQPFGQQQYSTPAPQYNPAVAPPQFVAPAAQQYRPPPVYVPPAQSAYPGQSHGSAQPVSTDTYGTGSAYSYVAPTAATAGYGGYQAGPVTAAPTTYSAPPTSYSAAPTYR
eukprot:CAMPEP_0119035144 /NCGR_PEP_ID=MMETSP1177-20130426/2104_1 /TAXON_ID=2985 /ORGANISM="Ochromonas sp, Strain CCMP1899" /LENGTH=622 /DNA_ID=CAMNT_0006993085 /DNA_START=91 /DNA_END=1959 /DNA_ORIENTATION=+